MRVRGVIVGLLMAVWPGSETCAAINERKPMDDLRALFALAEDVVVGEVVSVAHSEPPRTGRSCSWIILSLRVESVLKGRLVEKEIRIGDCTETFQIHNSDSEVAAAPNQTNRLIIFLIPESRVRGGGWDYVPLRGGVFEADLALVSRLKAIGSECWQRVNLTAGDVRQPLSSVTVPVSRTDDTVNVTLDDGVVFPVSRTLLSSLAVTSGFEVREAVRSPDRRRVALVIWGSLGAPQIAVIDADDQCAPVLLRTSGAAMAGNIPFAAPPGDPRDPVWLDARRLAFLAGYENRPTDLVYIENVETRQRFATRLDSPAKSLACRTGKLTAFDEQGRAMPLSDGCPAPGKP